MSKETKNFRTVTLDKEINNKIMEKINEENFNCSEWFSETFKREFMDVEEKKNQIQQLKKKIKKLEKEIKETKIRNEVYSGILSRAETRFLRSVPRRLREGINIKSLLGGFNVTFHKEFDLERFKKLVKSMQGVK